MAQNANWIDSQSFTEIQNKAKEIYSLFTDNEITLMADSSEIDNAAYNAEDLDKVISSIEAKSQAAINPLEGIRKVLQNIKNISLREYFEAFEPLFQQWEGDLVKVHDQIKAIEAEIADCEKHNLSTDGYEEKLKEALGELNFIRRSMEEDSRISGQLAAIWETILTDETLDLSSKVADNFKISKEQVEKLKTQLMGVNAELDKAKKKKTIKA